MLTIYIIGPERAGLKHAHILRIALSCASSSAWLRNSYVALATLTWTRELDHCRERDLPWLREDTNLLVRHLFPSDTLVFYSSDKLHS